MTIEEQYIWAQTADVTKADRVTLIQMVLALRSPQPTARPTPPAPPEAPKRSYEELYTELLYAVQNKVEGETRHETALRYIQEHEAFHGGSASMVESSEGGKGLQLKRR